MKSTAIPLTCSLALVAMLAASLSQWWAVNQLVLAVGGTMPRQMHSVMPPVSAPTQAAASSKILNTPAIADAQQGPAYEKFFESLVGKLNAVEKRNVLVEQQNQDLRDQIAATNNDIMEIQFRLDSHSESFRPLKYSPETKIAPDANPDDGPGVLPPRAKPAGEMDSSFNQ
jgi:hypothetical protein